MKKIIIYIFLSISFISFSVDKDISNMRLKFKEFLINVPQGMNLKNISLEDEKNNIELHNKKALDALKLLAINETNDYVFSNFKNMSDAKDIRNSLIYLENLAKATQIPNTKYYNSKEIKNIIIKSLEIILDKGYYRNGEENGNWWFWEIGIPKTLNELLVIAYDFIPSKLRNDLLDAQRYFQPDPRYSGMSPGAIYSTTTDKRLSEGGNRIDTALISFIRGILSENHEEIVESINSVDDVFKITKETNGVYEDGSFIQHSTVASNGSYGVVLLNGVSLFMYISGNTKYEMKNPAIENLYNSIINGYAYLSINGGLNDSVRGRGISRDNETDLNRGQFLAETIALISKGAPLKYKEKLESITKEIILSNNFYNPVNEIKNLTRKSIVKEIQNSNIKKYELNKAKIFGAMNRAVSFTNKGGKFLISMHSNRIANYETMNNENLRGFYTGDGMTYIYANDSSAFIEYWPTINPLLIPGTTELDIPRSDASGEKRVLNNLSKIEFAGGSTNNNIASIGFDFISWDEKLSAKKSYFLLEDGMLALGSNINSESNKAYTVIDNRIINENDDAKVFVNSILTKDNKNIYKKHSYIEYRNDKKDENIFYILLQNDETNVNITNRSGSFKEIGGKSDKIISKKFLEIIVNHGNMPKNKSYAYLVLPNYKENDIKKYNLSDIEILEQNENLHAVKIKSKNVLLLNSWNNKTKKINGLEINNKLSLIKEEKDNKLIISISDPTNSQKNYITFTINGVYKLDKSNNETVKINIKDNKTYVNLKLKDIGASSMIHLIKGE